MPRLVAVVLLLLVGCDSAEETPDPESSSAGGTGGSGASAGKGGGAGTGTGGSTGGAAGQSAGAAGEATAGNDAGSAGSSAGSAGATAPAARCALPVDPGPCEAAIPRWHYAGNSCREFTYGGCEGNENNFATHEDCAAECERFADACFLSEPDGSREDLDDCSECPPDRSSNGAACTRADLTCRFLPACGATDCTCSVGPTGALAWDCVSNLCSER